MTTRILGFDTSGSWCAAAVLEDTRVLAARAEDMTRGQTERLMPLLKELLGNLGIGWAELSAIGVGVGPGNFTGIRISVSAARGLALGLDVPAVGVTGFEARQAAYPGQQVGVPAPRDQVYVADPDPRLIFAAERPGVITEIAPVRLAEEIARSAAGRFEITKASPAPLYVKSADAAPARDVPPVILDP